MQDKKQNRRHKIQRSASAFSFFYDRSELISQPPVGTTAKSDSDFTDKEHPELYSVYNEGCVVDLAEEPMGDGGGDLCLENKVRTALHAQRCGRTPLEL
eukprot:5802781-Prymnesium_polylepis.1